jgi:predicted chitinase
MKKISEIQEKLKELGYYAGPIDGLRDSSKADLMKFQRDNSLDDDGIVGPMTERVLFGSNDSSLELEELILKVLPGCNKPLVRELIPHLLVELEKIDVLHNDLRLAFFLGQCAIETAYFRTMRELGDIRYFEKVYGHKTGIPPKSAEKRKLLKNWYIGRGVIQTTWDFNYKKAKDATGIDFLEQPWLLEEAKWAVISAAVFWKNNNLNSFADAKDIKGATKKINGGYNHLAERVDYTNRFLKVLRNDEGEGVAG